jgi:hypothetical protein
MWLGCVTVSVRHLPWLVVDVRAWSQPATHTEGSNIGLQVTSISCSHAHTCKDSEQAGKVLLRMLSPPSLPTWSMRSVSTRSRKSVDIPICSKSRGRDAQCQAMRESH